MSPRVRKGLRLSLRIGFALLFSFVLLEAGLHLSGYKGAYGYQHPDPHFRWLLKPGYSSSSEHSVVRINALGLRGKEVDPKKPAGTLRVACMGDSCTFGPDGKNAAPPYPETLESILLETTGAKGPRWETINAGIPGYSSFLGLRYYRERIAPLSPDIVTLYFGWNDHWINFNEKTDSEHVDSLRARLGGLRSANLLKAWLMRSQQPDAIHDPKPHVPAGPPGSARPGSDPNLPDFDKVRVPPEDYRRTLVEFVQEIRKTGARPILLTAPIAVDEKWGGGLLPYIAGGTQVRRLPVECYLALHLRYVSITREVAASERCECVDLEALFGKRERHRLFDSPAGDPIHANAEGMRLIAEAIADRILKAQGGIQETEDRREE